MINRESIINDKIEHLNRIFEKTELLDCTFLDFINEQITYLKKYICRII